MAYDNSYNVCSRNYSSTNMLIFQVIKNEQVVKKTLTAYRKWAADLLYQFIQSPQVLPRFNENLRFRIRVPLHFARKLLKKLWKWERNMEYK